MRGRFIEMQKASPEGLDTMRFRLILSLLYAALWGLVCFLFLALADLGRFKRHLLSALRLGFAGRHVELYG